MQKKMEIYDIGAELDELYGKEGTEERKKFDEEAYNFCVGQMVQTARKQEKMTQSELAEKIGSSKSYISQIENGYVEPSAGLFFRIMSALGLRVDITKPVMSI